MNRIYDTGVADDFVDRSSLMGRMGWIGTAIARLGVVIVLGVVFAVAVGVYEAKRNARVGFAALPPDARVVSPTEFDALVAAPDLPSRDLAVNAVKTEELRRVWADKINQKDDFAKIVDASRAGLLYWAEKSRCWTGPVDLAQALSGPCSAADPSIGAQLERYRANYRKDLETARRYEDEERLAALEYSNARGGAGAGLTPIAALVEARQDLESKAQGALRPVTTGFFTLPSAFDEVALGFLGGAVGSATLLLALIVFPAYAPLTFGAGRHFFLRMATGAVMGAAVMILLRLSIVQPNALVPAEFQQFAAQANALPEAQRLALYAFLAGLGAEQLAAVAKRYVEMAFHGGDATTPSVTAAPPAPAPSGASAPVPAGSARRAPAMGTPTFGAPTTASAPPVDDLPPDAPPPRGGVRPAG